MKLSIGGWIGIIAGIAGMTIGIIAVLMNGGSSAVYVAAGMVLVFAGMAFLFYKLFFYEMILRNRLSKTGIDGTALIKEVRDTGVTVNYNPQVKLLLEVKNNLGQLYTTTIRTLVSRIQPDVYRPGMTVPVKIDPKNEQNVIIDTDRTSRDTARSDNVYNPARPQNTISFNAEQVNAMKQDIEKLTALENDLLVTGHSAKALIKNYQWLGANVNGNNPYAEITLEVLPEDAPAFESKVRAVISEHAINKYQPGCQVYVKYDPADKGRVVIHHS